MTFAEYINDWFQQIVEDHEDDQEWIDGMFKLLDRKDEYLEDGETHLSYLQNFDDDEVIWDELFGQYSEGKLIDDLPDKRGILDDMLTEAGEYYINHYDFADALLDDMADHMEDYDDPKLFFQDLFQGGCASGIIGKFIYNSDCKDFYVDNIDSMEYFKEDLENEIGETIKNTTNQRHYTFMCWLCYEELARKIAAELWPDEF